METKVINLFGAPGAGKSTIASGIFYELRKRGYNTELAFEWIKQKLFEGTKYPFTDQLYTFAKQHKQINQLAQKAEYIITDSPLLLSLIYGKNELDVFSKMVKEYSLQYNNVNFLIKRNHSYVEFGRNQNEQEADSIYSEIKKMLDENRISYTELGSTTAVDQIIQSIIKK